MVPYSADQAVRHLGYAPCGDLVDLRRSKLAMIVYLDLNLDQRYLTEAELVVPKLELFFCSICAPSCSETHTPQIINKTFLTLQTLLTGQGPPAILP